MKAITLRNLPKELALRIARVARERGISLNRAVIDMLQAAGGSPAAPRPPVAHRDLDALFGVWSPEDLDGFNASLASQRGIDPGIWTG